MWDVPQFKAALKCGWDPSILKRKKISPQKAFGSGEDV
jgi:hypothetical protein